MAAAALCGRVAAAALAREEALFVRVHSAPAPSTFQLYILTNMLICIF